MHPEVTLWYDWASALLAKDKESKLGSPYDPGLTRSAERAYRQGTEGKFLLKPHKIPLRYVEVSSLSSLENVKKAMNSKQAAALQQANSKVIEKQTRVV